MSNVQRGLTCRGSAFVNPVAKASPNRQLCFQMWDPGEAESGALRRKRVCSLCRNKSLQVRRQRSESCPPQTGKAVAERCREPSIDFSAN